MNSRFPRQAWQWPTILSLCVLSLYAGPGAHPASATDGAPTYRVVNVERGDVLNVRSGPSGAHSVVGTVLPGAAGIRVTGPCRDWCPIEYKSVSGWVKRRFLAVEAAVAPFTQGSQPTTSYWRVTGVAANDVLMVRTGPSQQAPVAHVYPPNAACVRGECQGPWCQVRIPAREGHQIGWVDAKQLAPSDAACN